MGSKVEEELGAILENVRQLTESYTKAIPTPEEIENIQRAYAEVLPNTQSTADLIQAYGHHIPQGTEDANNGSQQQAYPFAATPENIAKITEAVNRLVSPEELHRISEATARMKGNSGEPPLFGDDLASLVQMAGSLRNNPAATEELVALQRTLMQQNAPNPRRTNTADEAPAQKFTIWKTVYIILGIAIVVLLLLMLIVPDFSASLQGLFR